MKPKLPRFMLWTDKTSMEEFLREPINEKLYGFYLELRGERWHFGPDNSAVLLFNEIYYQLTKVEYEHDLDLNMDDYTQEIEANIGKVHSIIIIYEMFFAFLLLRENNSNVARHFQNVVFLRYNSTWNKRTNCALGAIIKEEKKYLVDLKPYPCPVKSLESEVLQWDVITNNFNPSSIREVLNLWSSKEEKITVLHLIEDEFKRIIRRPVAIKDGNLHSILRADQFFSNMHSELGGIRVEKNTENSQDNDVTKLEYPFVIENDLAVVIIEKIQNYVNGKSSPKDKMMPIRAAIEARVIRRPTLNEIKRVFGNDFIAKSSYHNYTDPNKEPFGHDKCFQLMVTEFEKLIA